MLLLDHFTTGKDAEGYKRVPTTIVFVGTRRDSDVISIWLIRRGFRAFAHNSDRNMETRLKAINGVQSGVYDIIVGTDALCRGINIPNVKTVINMSLPNNSPINYIHRIGRTGRVGNIGRAISFFDVARDSGMAAFLEKVETFYYIKNFILVSFEL
jgi:superfamily II DNA/RNA helicase